MSRARNLKPGFFKNEELAELPFEFRILFQGLWCLADREGRLEDRPKRIKAEVFPYDSVDVAVGLAELERAGFITRYAAGNIPVIQVLAFSKHQNPHCKESASTIPAQCKHGASTEISGTSPADSLNPITDSPFSDSKKGRGDKSPLVLPEWLPGEAWDDWHAYRNSRKGWTGKARELSLRTLTDLREQGHDPRAVIHQSIERGWTGLFPVRAAGPPVPTKPSAAADLRGKTYAATPIDQLPPDLRAAAERALRDDG